MAGLNRDALTAIVLLIVEAVFLQQTFQIREMSFATMGADVWPRAILIPLILCTLGYLAQSLRRGPDVVASENAEAGETVADGNWLYRYRNVFFCYGLFLAFLLTLDFFGMLIGGILFVFLALTAMGGASPRALALHALIAVVAVGAMWSIFTFALRVILPEGVILSTW
ncbi:MAG: tripartite tricarboxylate transporter TctB family protein [Rhodospirillales bacterium]